MRFFAEARRRRGVLDNHRGRLHISRTRQTSKFPGTPFFPRRADKNTVPLPVCILQRISRRPTPRLPSPSSAQVSFISSFTRNRAGSLQPGKPRPSRRLASRNTRSPPWTLWRLDAGNNSRWGHYIRKKGRSAGQRRAETAGTSQALPRGGHPGLANPACVAASPAGKSRCPAGPISTINEAR